jgi:hypothetical protein
MLAKDCKNGVLYDLPQIGHHNPYRAAECHGFNNDRSWVLFLTFDEWGGRHIRMVGLDVTVSPTPKL